MNKVIAFQNSDIPNLPPPSFFEGAPAFDDCYGVTSTTPPSIQEVKFDDDAPVKTLCVRLTRATDGLSEIRLLVRREKDVPDQYILQHGGMVQETRQRTLLMKKNDSRAPANEKQAIAAFDQLVARAYPAEKLRNGRVVAICKVLL